MSGCPFGSRRRFIAMAGGLAAALSAGTSQLGAKAAATAQGPEAAVGKPNTNGNIPLRGPYQAGIATPQQKHILFASFDLVTDKASEVARILGEWTDAAARMTAGQPGSRRRP